ncbi:acetyl/propionyl/methylcrotonyl-CoA carboxylase subunit alpha [Celerinatantimonas sp. YJH-8]|uniref:acetyl/propionyl/methylcrotonyl-CoA carboxylase subunit alpha n=1 Tax=Celerinatantimonas sp. YJH-8 TaxID=3228714 RepID=UPI0038C79B22
MSTTHNNTQKHKVLIANRGEIAVRIIRACRDLGMDSVAVYSDSDAQALHVQMADEAYALHGDTSAETYLNIDKLLKIANHSDATMVHPGYGFLSERAEFARAVQQQGLLWVGPNPETIEALGDKVKARQLAARVGAPLVAGTHDPVASAAEAYTFAKEHGLPIAIKAAFGGGGRGLKVAWSLDEVEAQYESAVREAVAAFGRGECFIEQFLHNPRHIEAQVIADRQGHVVVLGTRDCSLQRRNQKLVEEAPAPFMSEQQRQQIHQAARDICQSAGYIGVATVEFMLSQNGTISFLEVNTRLQVEHPVTEETTGVDLVVEQLNIAAGLPLSVDETPKPWGHAMEFRINAEDPARGFLPTPGTITDFRAPSGPGIRLDSGVTSGSVVSGYFDSMMAKLIVTGNSREQVLSRARRALQEFQIEGVASVLPFHRQVVNQPDFAEDFAVHTRWIETSFESKLEASAKPEPINDQRMQRFWIEIDGKRVQIGLPADILGGIQPSESISAERSGAPADSRDLGEVKAPMTGTLFKWLVEDKCDVAAGTSIAIMEAMKMEVPVVAEVSGKIHLQVEQGQLIEADAIIATIVS